MARRETEAGALASFLRREKWLEDARLHFGRHARAVVAHGQHHIIARHDLGPQPAILVVERKVFRLDGQLAPARHGVTRVDRKVHDDLLHLPRIGLDAPDIFRQHRDETHVLAQQAAQHVVHVAHDEVQIEHARLEHLLAAEGEQLPRQRRRALGGLANLRHVLMQNMIRRKLLQGHIAVAENRREDVVEIMRHAAGQLPDGLHFLRLLKLFLQFLALRHIARIEDDSGHDGIVEQIISAAFEDTIRAVAMAETERELRSVPLPLQRRLKRLRDEGHILGMHELERVFAAILLRLVAQHRLNGMALVADGAVRFEDGDQVQRIVREPAEIRLALPHLRGLAFALQHAAQLRADVPHQLQKTAGRLLFRAGEKFHHADHVASGEERKGESRSQSEIVSQHGARAVSVRAELQRPRGLTAGKNVARQTLVTRKMHRQSEVAKHAQRRRAVRVPELRGDQFALAAFGFFTREHMGKRPVVVPAQFLQRYGHRLGERLRLVRRDGDRLQ